jgi:hypothetical protein
MPSRDSTLLVPADLRRELEQHILDRTGRRVHSLKVDVLPERIVLEGRSPSYYVKQLAQHCVWDILPGARLENDIVVSG